MEAKTSHISGWLCGIKKHFGIVKTDTKLYAEKISVMS